MAVPVRRLADSRMPDQLSSFLSSESMLPLSAIWPLLNRDSQPFWGEMVAQRGAGPRPIHHRSLTMEKLREAIEYCLKPGPREAAAQIAAQMDTEVGVKTAVHSFHRHLPVDVMACDLIPNLPATWWYKKSKRNIRLSGAAAEILIQNGRINADDLRLYKPKPFIVEARRWDPLTSSLSSTMGISYEIGASLSGFWRNPQNLQKEASRQRDLSGEPVSGASSKKDIAKMVGASAMSLPQVTGALLKGVAVDLPVAMSEGFRNAPKLYGEKVSDHAPVTDWKSGMAVAGKTFTQQMGEGLTDFVRQPAKGAAKDGVVGFGKGVGIGTLQVITKPAAAAFGLVGYTGQGIYKSLHAKLHTDTKKSVASAQRVQDKYFVRANGREIDPAVVLDEFERQCAEKGESVTSTANVSRVSTALSRRDDAAPAYEKRES